MQSSSSLFTFESLQFNPVLTVGINKCDMKWVVILKTSNKYNYLSNFLTSIRKIIIFSTIINSIKSLQ